MRRRTTIITLLLILSGGAIVNMAVAWGVHASMDPHLPGATRKSGSEPGGRFGPEGADYFGWLVSEYTSPYATRVFSRWYDKVVGGGVSGGWPDEPAEPLIPSWAPHLSPENRVACGAYHHAIAWEYGWPWRSVGGSAHVQRTRTVSRTWTTEIEYHFAFTFQPSLLRDPNDHWDVRLFVYRPLFPGFLINTLFYATILWVIFLAPFTARRMIRRRRGQCEKCAYPIGVSPVCTECGAAVPRKVET